MLHGAMAKVTVRVTPRAGQRGVEVRPAGIFVQVRAAPEGGRATQEAARALAQALGVPPSRVRLRSGASARVKVFEVTGLSEEDVSMRLRAT
jgi:uncharacterized protein YggU (UPF0235/DUF167 family)